MGCESWRVWEQASAKCENAGGCNDGEMNRIVQEIPSNADKLYIIVTEKFRGRYAPI